MWKLMKDLIGKDLSQFSLPVFIKEPCSLMMKGAECGYYLGLMQEAGHEQDSMARMVKVVTTLIAVFNQVVGRVSMPFNSLLGETYELVTSSFRFVAEMVCLNPPIFVM
jgi:hypothetical protein